MPEERKKRIFIGSSSETKDLAIKIKDKLEPFFECKGWWDYFFNPGNYVYTDLIKKAIGHDYAIMIGGADDKVIRLSSNDEKLSPRDNIYLEFGMYSGILSTSRILFLIHEDCRVASDLAGMTLKTYKTEEEAVSICSEWIERSLAGKFDEDSASKIVDLLPTMGIAVGYFHNFLEPLLKKLSNIKVKTFSYQDQEYAIKEKKLIISIPAYLQSSDHAVEEYKAELMEQNGLEDSVFEKYRILLNPEALDSQMLEIYDMPSTLLAVLKTVDFIFGIEGSILGPEDAQNAKYRALDNFLDTLQDFMKGQPRLSKYVEFRRFNIE